MQKHLWKVLSMIFGACLLALAVGPVQAWAAGIDESGTLVIGYQDEAAEGDGWSYDGNHILTLNGYDGGSLSLTGAITIQLVGENRLTASNASDFGMTGISNTYYNGLPPTPPLPWDDNPDWQDAGEDTYSIASVTIVGPGSLDVVLNGQGSVIVSGFEGNNLTIRDGASVNITISESQSQGAGIYLANLGSMSSHYDYETDYGTEGILSVDNASLKVVAHNPFLYVFGFSFNNCTVHAKSWTNTTAVSNAYRYGYIALANVRGAYLETQQSGTNKNLRSTSTGLAGEIQLVPGEGVDHKPGWAKENGYWVFYDDDGNMLVNGRVNYDGTEYFFGADGRLVTTAQWAWDNTGLFYIQSGGAVRTTPGWFKQGGNYYYLDWQGYATINDLVYDLDQTTWELAQYCFGADGKLVINGTVDVDGIRYFIKNGKVYDQQVIEYPGVVEGTCGTCSWSIDDDGLLTVYPTDGESGVLAPDYENTSNHANTTRFSWYPYHNKITGVVVVDGVSATSLKGFLMNCVNLTTVDLSALDTSQTTDMSYMFWNCPSLTSIDLTGFDTSQVTDMSWMFEATGLTSLDVSFFNTSNVTNMQGMFADNPSLATIDMSGWDTSSVTDMSSMFGSQGITSLDLSSFDTRNVTTMRWMLDCANLTTLTVGDLFVQPDGDDTWSAPWGTSWIAASDGKSYWGYGLAHRVGADTYTRAIEPYTDGWHQVDGNWYYFSFYEQPRTNAFAEAYGKQYYLGPDGKILPNALVKSYGVFYYTDKNGSPVTNTWKQVGDYWYYFGSDGIAYFSRWLQSDSDWYYFDEESHLCIDYWLKSGRWYYYFGKNGKLVTNNWAERDGTWYYLDSNGLVVETGWAKYNSYYLFLIEYVPAKNMWINIDGVDYYFNGSGVCTKVGR